MKNEIKSLKKLIDYFRDNKIDYVVLGRKDSLKEIVHGDIDIVVSQAKFKTIETIIDNFCISNNMSFIQCFQHESTAKYTILSDNLNHHIICPDICTHFVRDKRLLIRQEVLLKNKHEKVIEGFTVNALKPSHEFLYYFLKKIDKKQLGIREYEHLFEQFNLTESSVVASLLKPYFFSDSIDQIISIFKNNKKEELDFLMDKLRVELHKKRKISFSFFIKDLLLKFKRVIKKTGISIAVLGPDGSGKSTVINGLMHNLNLAFRDKKYYHLIPREVKGENIVNTNPQGEKPYSFLISIIKLLYLIIKYNLGYINVYFRQIKSTLVVFDRYFDDIFIDKLRFRFKGPNMFLHLAMFFIPKPQIYIYLDTSGEVAFKRKNELSVDEINRQRVLYLSLIKKKKHGYIVNAEQDIDKVVFQAEEKVLLYLKNRQAKRF